MSDALRRRARRRIRQALSNYQKSQPYEAQTRAEQAMLDYERALRRRDWLKRQPLPPTQPQAAMLAHTEAMMNRREK